MRPDEFTRPRLALPEGACDCHMHVFGAPERYQVAARRAYTPVPAPLSQWREVAARLGLARVVLVQPSAYGSDNSCMLDAMREMGAPARGVAVIDEAASPSDLAALHAAGVRGVRLNLKTLGDGDAGALRARMTRLAERIGPLGWHIQIYADLAVIAAVAGVIRAMPVAVVLDHMGGARAAPGVSKEGFRSLLDLLAEGRCWVKLSGAYRVSDAAPHFADSTPIARALIAANPDRLVWGTDWPHIGGHAEAAAANAPSVIYRDLDAGALLDLLAEVVGDDATFRRILVDNPARLYGY